MYFSEETRLMKKLSKVIALILMLSMVLCSCGKTSAFSNGLDQNGYFQGVSALDYFEFKNMDDVRLSQSDVDNEIEYLVTEAFPDQIHIEEGTIKETDTVNIDYVGYIDGEAFENGSTNEQGTDVNIATTNYIPGFLEQLVGHQPGDEFDINVTFPDPYENNPELSGKPAVFKTKVNYIVEYTPAEFNDDFVMKNLYQSFYYYYGVSITTAQEYLDFIKESIVEDYIVTNCTISEGKEIPEAVQKTINDATILRLKEYAEKSQGVELITYLKNQYQVNSEEEYLEKYSDNLKTQAKNAMLIQALSEYFNVSISDDDVKEYFTSAGEENKNALSYDEAVKEYGLPYLKQFLLQDKVLSHVSEKAIFE